MKGLRILYLKKILLENTDVNNTLTIKEIIAKLNSCGIDADRKTIYNDIELLKLFGIDIARTKTKTYNYFIANREFELAELKLLADVIQSSQFITYKKSFSLIKKLNTLISIHEAKQLEQQIIINGRIKNLNEKIYYNIEKINNAILTDKQIEFKYFEYNLYKEKVYKYNGEIYSVSPYGTCWDNKRYYFIAYHSRYNKVCHFRIDKMDSIEISKMNCYKLEKYKNFNIAEYTKNMFSMFKGKIIKAEIEFKNSEINLVIDKFGQGLDIIKRNSDSFIVCVEVSLSPNFISWIYKFEDRAKVLAPDNLVKYIKNSLEKMNGLYK